MAIKIVTAKKGEPHITSSDDGAMHQGIFGVDDYVLNVGEKFRAELVSNNEIKIYDGEGMMQGRHWRIEPGTYESVTIDNGSQGMKRKDLIVARYTKDSGTGVENVELAVLKGSETEGNATAPEATKGDIRNGDLSHEMVLYTVALDGLNVTAVDPGFYIIMNMMDVQNAINEFGRKRMYSGTVVYTGLEGRTSVPLFTRKELMGIFGLEDPSSTNFTIVVNNGDTGASDAHVNGVSWSADGQTAYVVFDRPDEGNIRINYTVIYTEEVNYKFVEV